MPFAGARQPLELHEPRLLRTWNRCSCTCLPACQPWDLTADEKRGQYAGTKRTATFMARCPRILDCFDGVSLHQSQDPTSLERIKKAHSPSPGATSFEKMGTIKISHRSISVSPCKRSLLVLVYDLLPPEVHSQPIHSRPEITYRKSKLMEQTITSLTKYTHP
jgi:hypothetical protein